MSAQVFDLYRFKPLVPFYSNQTQWPNETLQAKVFELPLSDPGTAWLNPSITWINLFTLFLKFALRIPFHLLKSILGFSLCKVKILLEEIIWKQNPSAIAIGFMLLLITCHIRRRLHFWKQRQIPFECLEAHLAQLRSWHRPVDDIGRVQRYGKIFG